MDNSQPKKRFSLGRVARLTFRTLALTMLLLLLVGWVASYFGTCALICHAKNRHFAAASYYGRLETGLFSDGLVTNRVWEIDFAGHDAWTREQAARAKPFIFDARMTGSFVATAPYWFLTTLAAMAAALSFKRTWRFTTRQLLLATTAVAAVLAAAVWSMRG